MGRVLTNNTAFAYSVESSLGIATDIWKQLEPNDISTFGPEIATVAREPISKDRQRKKGTITDLDSAVEFEADTTLDSMIDFIECFTFAQSTSNPSFGISSVVAAGSIFNIDGDPTGLTVDHLVFGRGLTGVGNDGLHEVTAIVASVNSQATLTLSVGVPSALETVTIGTRTYTWVAQVSQPNHVTIGASIALSTENLAKAINLTGTEGVEYGQGTLVHPEVTASDTATEVIVTAIVEGLKGNDIVSTETMVNGVWDGVTLGTTTAGVDGQITATGSVLVDETPTAIANATLEVAGVRGAAGDLTIDANGDLVSSVLDFTTLDWIPGQAIHVGGQETANRFFGNGSGENFGFARIVTIAANLVTLDKKLFPFVTDDGTDDNSGGVALEVDLLFGRFIRNVGVDDVDFIERSLTFEAAWDGLAANNTDEYEYAVGNFCNEISVELPLTDKSTATFGFVGTDTDPPTGTRKDGADTPLDPVQTTAFNTTADIARLRVTEADESGLTTDFKSVTISLNNNVTPEKVLSVLGAKFMNSGIFEVDLETQVLFTNGDVLAAIRNNDTVTMDFSLQNSDGGIFFDLPAMTLGDGSRELPINETVLLNLTGQVFKDPTFDTSIGVSIFPFLPTA